MHRVIISHSNHALEIQQCEESHPVEALAGRDRVSVTCHHHINRIMNLASDQLSLLRFFMSFFSTFMAHSMTVP
jgi:hypothetical protein